MIPQRKRYLSADKCKNLSRWGVFALQLTNTDRTLMLANTTFSKVLHDCFSINEIPNPHQPHLTSVSS